MDNTIPKIAIDIPTAGRIGVPPVLRVKDPDKRDAGYPLGATGGCSEKMKSIAILGYYLLLAGAHP